MKPANISDVDFVKGDGVVPVVAQESATGQVLMVAFANREAIEKTLQTNQAHYCSKSSQKLWRQGEESGHIQTVKKVYLDCDGDTLVYVVDQAGPACQTGEHGCFFRKLPLG